MESPSISILGGVDAANTGKLKTVSSGIRNKEISLKKFFIAHSEITFGYKEVLPFLSSFILIYYL